jgi:nucleotide-binding universal stress UspA family protein
MICVGFDGLPGGRDAAALARVLAGDDGAPLTVVAVVPFPPRGFGEDDERLAAKAESWDELVERLEARGAGLIEERLAAGTLAGVEFERKVVIDDSPARALMAVAESEEPEMLVLGSTERGTLGRVLAGTVPAKLLSGAPCAIAVAPRGFADREERPPATVAVAFNGSDESRRALSTAAGIARRIRAGLLLLAVVEPQGPLAYERELAHEAGRILRGEGLDDLRAERLRAETERALAELGEAPDARIEIVHGDPVDCLVDRAGGDVDLLVLGSRGYGPLRRTFLGSVSSGVLKHASCPVLVVPR